MDSEATADNELIERCRQGDHGAFTMLYERYRLQLFSYLNRMLPGRPHVADDLFQQVWLRMLDNLDRYTEQQRFISWLYRIAHNLVIDHVRREARCQTEEVTEKTAVDDAGNPWDALDQETLMTALETAVGGLAAEQREVLSLRQQGMSFKEIAAVQKTGINTVLGRMHYAVRNLRKQLAAYV